MCNFSKKSQNQEQDAVLTFYKHPSVLFQNSPLTTFIYDLDCPMSFGLSSESRAPDKSGPSTHSNISQTPKASPDTSNQTRGTLARGSQATSYPLPTVTTGPLSSSNHPFSATPFSLSSPLATGLEPETPNVRSLGQNRTLQTSSSNTRGPQSLSTLSIPANNPSLNEFPTSPFGGNVPTPGGLIPIILEPRPLKEPFVRKRPVRTGTPEQATASRSEPNDIPTRTDSPISFLHWSDSDSNSGATSQESRPADPDLNRERTVISKIASRYRPFARRHHSRSRSPDLHLNSIPLEHYPSLATSVAASATSSVSVPATLSIPVFRTRTNDNSQRRSSILTFMYSNSIGADLEPENSNLLGSVNDLSSTNPGLENGTGIGWPGYGGVTKRPINQKSRFSRPSKETLQTFLYKFSLVFLILCFTAVVVATPIDMIIQSQRTGQYWNAIIIIASYALVAITAAIFTIIRIVVTRRALSAIPHQYIPGLADIPIDLYRNITSELDRCRKISRNSRPIFQDPPVHVSHPGLMPPAIVDLGRLADTPYIDVIRLASEMIATKAEVLHPLLSRAPGMSLRDYVYTLHSIKIIDLPIENVDEFIDQYECARFSGNLITEYQFGEFMESCRRLMLSIKYYPNPNAYSPTIGQARSAMGVPAATTPMALSRAGSVYRGQNALQPVSSNLIPLSQPHRGSFFAPSGNGAADLAADQLFDFGASTQQSAASLFDSVSLGATMPRSDSASLKKITSNSTIQSGVTPSRVSTRSNANSNYAYEESYNQGDSATRRSQEYIDPSHNVDLKNDDKKRKGKSRGLLGFKRHKHPTPSFRDPWGAVPAPVTHGIGHLPSSNSSGPAGRSSSVSSTGTMKWNPEYESSHEAFVNSVTDILRDTARQNTQFGSINQGANNLQTPQLGPVSTDNSSNPNSNKQSIQLQQAPLPTDQNKSQIWQQQQQIQQLQQLQQQLHTGPQGFNSSNGNNVRRTTVGPAYYMDDGASIKRKTSSSSIVIHKTFSQPQVQQNRPRSNTDSLSRIAAMTITPSGVAGVPSAHTDNSEAHDLASFVTPSTALAGGTSSVSPGGLKLSLVSTRSDGTSDASAADVAAAAAAEYTTVFRTAQDLAPRGSLFQARPLSGSARLGGTNSPSNSGSRRGSASMGAKSTADYGTESPGVLLMAALKAKYDAATNAGSTLIDPLASRNSQQSMALTTNNRDTSVFSPLKSSNQVSTPPRKSPIALRPAVPGTASSTVTTGPVSGNTVFHTANLGTPSPAAVARNNNIIVRDTSNTASLFGDFALPAVTATLTASTIGTSTSAISPMGTSRDDTYSSTTPHTPVGTTIENSDANAMTESNQNTSLNNFSFGSIADQQQHDAHELATSKSLRKRVASQIRSWSRGSSQSPDRTGSLQKSPGQETFRSPIRDGSPSSHTPPISPTGGSIPGIRVPTPFEVDSRGAARRGSSIRDQEQIMPEPWFGDNTQTPTSPDSPVSRVSSNTGSVIIHKK